MHNESEQVQNQISWKFWSRCFPDEQNLDSELI